MEYDCGNTGCAGGGGTFALFVLLIWIMIAWWSLFSEPISFWKYIKSIPERLMIFSIGSAFCLALAWVIIKIENFIFGR
jgi:hypothetical protein